MRKLFRSFMLLPFLLPLFGHAQDDLPRKREVLAKEEISISSFDRVVVSGGGNLYFHYAPSASLELEGSSSCTEAVEAFVSGNTLYIRSKGGDENCLMEINIGTPQIKEIQQKGGGRIEVKEGFAPMAEFRCSIDGGGEVYLEALKIDSLFVSIDGGGELHARVSELLDGKIRGGGLVRYSGSPKVLSDISGGGLIKRK